MLFTSGFKETLSHEDRTLCECIIFSIADLFAHASHFEIVQAGNGIDAIAVGLVLLSNEDNINAINDENPLCLLLKLALNDWSYNSRIVNGIASTIWRTARMLRGISYICFHSSPIHMKTRF